MGDEVLWEGECETQEQTRTGEWVTMHCALRLYEDEGELRIDWRRKDCDENSWLYDSYDVDHWAAACTHLARRVKELEEELEEALEELDSEARDLFEDEVLRLKEAIRDAGVVHETRKYLEIQLDRDTWESCQRAGGLLR